MKKPAIFLSSIWLLISPSGLTAVPAQPAGTPESIAVASPTASPSSSASPSAAATPANEKGRFFGLFGSKKDPSPSPSPSATPTPTPTPQPKKSVKAGMPKVAAVTAAATPQSSPTPSEKKRSFFSFLWGRKSTEPAPSPSPAPSAARTPKPTPPAAAPVRTPAQKTEAASTPSPTPEPTPKAPEPTPFKRKPITTTIATPTPTPAATPKPTPEATPTPNTADSEKSLNPGAIPFVPEQSSTKASATDISKESQRYRELKTKALEDKRIIALRDKADTAVEDAEIARASRAYYKALFSKMRKMDPAMGEYISQVEAATMRRLDQPAPKAKE